MDTSLVFHILFGFSALATGTLSMLLKKGSLLHKKLGVVFFYAMMGVVVTALWMSILKWNLFLLAIAIFALYQSWAGWRSIKNKSLTPNAVDYFLLGIGLANGILMIASLQIVLLVFGSIQLLLAVGDISLFYKIRRKKVIHTKAWLRRHIGMMVGSYIATFTAFLVTNFPSVNPGWLLWLAPTFIFVPLMQYWTRKWAS